MYKYFILLYSFTMLSICSGEKTIIEEKDPIINRRSLIKISGDTYNAFKENITDKYIELYIKNITHKAEITEDNAKMYVCNKLFILDHLIGVKQEYNIYFRDPTTKKISIRESNQDEEITPSNDTVTILILLDKETDQALTYSEFPETEEALINSEQGKILFGSIKTLPVSEKNKAERTLELMRQISDNKQIIYKHNEKLKKPIKILQHFQPFKAFIISQDAIIEHIIKDDGFPYTIEYLYNFFASETEIIQNLYTLEMIKELAHNEIRQEKEAGLKSIKDSPDRLKKLKLLKETCDKKENEFIALMAGNILNKITMIKSTTESLMLERLKGDKNNDQIIAFLKDNNSQFLNKAIIIKKYNEAFHLGYTYEVFKNGWIQQQKDLLEDKADKEILTLLSKRVKHTNDQVIKIDTCYLNQISKTLQFYYDFLTKAKESNEQKDFLTFEICTENEFFLNYADNIYYQSIIFYDNNILYNKIYKKYAERFKKVGIAPEKSKIKDFINIVEFKRNIEESGKLGKKFNDTRKIILESKAEHCDTGNVSDITDQELADQELNMKMALNNLSSKIQSIKNLYSDLSRSESELKVNNFALSNLTINNVHDGTLDSKLLNIWLLISLFNIDFDGKGFFLKQVSNDIFTQHIYDHIYSLSDGPSNTKIVYKNTSMFKTDKQDSDFSKEFIKNFLTGKLPIEYIKESGTSAEIIEIIIKIKTDNVKTESNDWRKKDSYIPPILGVIQKDIETITETELLSSTRAIIILEKSLLGYYIKTAYPISKNKYEHIKENNQYIKCSGDNFIFSESSKHTFELDSKTFMNTLKQIDKDKYDMMHRVLSGIKSIFLNLSSSNI